MAAVTQRRVATPPGSWSLWIAALGVSFLLGILGAIAAAQVARTPEVATNPEVASADSYASYREAVADLSAALSRHDGPAIARSMAAVDRSMDAGTMEAIYADRQRLIANLGAAEARHDQRLIQHFKAQLSALCPPITTGSSPSFCR